MARANQAETAAAAAAAAAAAVAPASAETRCHTREQSTAGEGVGQRPVFRHSGGDGGGPGRQRRRLRGRTGAVGLSAAVLMLLVAASILTDSSPSPEQQQQQQQQRERELSLATEPNRGNVETGADIAAGGDAGGAFAEEGEGSVLGMAASSSMWDVDAPRARGLVESSPVRYRRGLLFNNNPNPNLRGGGVIPKAGARQAAKQRPLGEHNMLHDFVKEPLDFLDLDDVQDGYLWIPVSVNKFDPSTTDPLVKMCQVNYAKYSAAPWLLPMGGLLSINSGCADIKADTVQIVRMSTLKRILAESKVPITPPTGFIFHETRCGSTLVANMLASVQTNVMWSESTGPWKVMHTCPKCSRDQIVPWLKIIMDAMSRSARHNHFYFKFQSSEDIEAVTTAFPNVPWIFIFREPVEVMMSRLGAQRIGMEGMEKEVAARVEKGMKPVKSAPKKGVKSKEASTAQQLSGLCKKAINAFEAHPGKGMMVEYPHLPDGIVTTVLPMHYKVTVSSMDKQRMMDTTKMYSKVASFGKGSTTESKFTEDTGTKHDAASVAVQEAAQSLLYPDFYKLRSLSTWSDLQQQ